MNIFERQKLLKKRNVLCCAFSKRIIVGLHSIRLEIEISPENLLKYKTNEIEQISKSDVVKHIPELKIADISEFNLIGIMDSVDTGSMFSVAKLVYDTHIDFHSYLNKYEASYRRGRTNEYFS